MAGRKLNASGGKILITQFHTTINAQNAEIMDRHNKFQGLKNLHQNLHSRKGFTNINSPNNASKQVVHVDNGFVVASNIQENETIKTESSKRAPDERGSENNLVDDTNNLLKAVKSVYKDNNVKLTQPKIFVGNISYKLSTSQLKEFFSGFGQVIYAQIVKDRVRKRSKG